VVGEFVVGEAVVGEVVVGDAMVGEDDVEGIGVGGEAEDGTVKIVDSES